MMYLSTLKYFELKEILSIVCYELKLTSTFINIYNILLTLTQTDDLRFAPIINNIEYYINSKLR